MLVGIAVLVPASWVARAAGQQTLTFVLSAAAVVPLAGLLGQATEELTARTGPRVGGLLNATFGNAAELVIGLLLLAHGEIDVVRASITGSILGNLLLVLGASLFAGGLRHKRLEFSAQAASTHIASMAIAVAGILMPTLYAAHRHATHFRVESISVVVAAFLLALYGATLVFSLVTHTDVFRGPGGEDEAQPTWPLSRAVAALAAAGVLVAVESDLLVGALEPAVRQWGLSKLWVGLVLVPIVGNAAEHSTAVIVAMKGKVDLALDIAIGSSAQVALLVAPLLVFAGLLFGHDLTLVLGSFELGALALSVAVVALLCQDGASDWLEGAQLLGVYGIVATASFFIGKS